MVGHTRIFFFAVDLSLFGSHCLNSLRSYDE
jgi:hypothetical protein